MRRLPPLLLALAGCASLAGQKVRVEAIAIQESGGVRVRFRRMEPGTAGNLPRLFHEGGKLVEVTYSPDRLSVGVLWAAPRGVVRCSFAYGGEAALGAEAAQGARWIDYMFLDEPGARVTARLASGALLPRVMLVVAAESLPATLEFPGLSPFAIDGRPAAVEIPLPRDEDGALVEGEFELVLRLPGGVAHKFLLGVDPDGTLCATTGYVRNW